MIINVNQLSKVFTQKKQPSFTAVDAISFSITAGERVAFIGPNGAGKSTTLKMLTGILFPTHGHATVAGLTPWQQRQKLAYEIGIVFGQRSQLWYHLPVRDSFKLLAAIYDVPKVDFQARIEHVSEVLQLDSLLDQSVKNLSLGQRMRCEIAASLLHKPKIVFLDEPTIGLDITAKALLREHLKHLANTENTTIILTSHDTGDIEEICDRVILINHGKILLDKPLNELRASFLTKKQITFVTHEEKPELHLAATTLIRREPHRITLSVDQTQQTINHLVTHALNTLTVQDLTIENEPLEEIIRNLYEAKHHE